MAGQEESLYCSLCYLVVGSWGATPTPPVQEPRLQPGIPHSAATIITAELMGWSTNIAAGHTNTSSQWNSGSGAVSSMGTTGGMVRKPRAAIQS